MDQARFDQIARALGAGTTRRGGLRAALGGLLGFGVGAGVTAPDAEAKDRRNGRNDGSHGAGGHGHGHADAARKRRRRKKCIPACAAGQTCVKGACRCDDGGATCGAACCLIGQECQAGQCVTLPEPGQCIAAGQVCKSVGIPCCAGLVCASGQGGTLDVACYAPKTGACQSTQECVYGMVCHAGRCAPPQPAPLGATCDLAAQQLCASPDAVCTVYTAEDAPVGTHCTLPLRKVCTGDPDCTCYHCDFVDDLAGPDGRTSNNTKACCLPETRACAADQDCCAGLICVDGACAVEEICQVCLDGSCQFTSIKEAYDALPDGSVISIAPGVYDEEEIVLPGDGAKSATFRACRGLNPANPVVWRNTAYQGTLIIVVTQGAPVTLTFQNLTFTQNPDQGLNIGLFQLYGGATQTNRMTVSMTGCTLKDSSAQNAALAIGRYTDTTITDCTFTNLSSTDGSARGGAINAINNGESTGLNTLTVLRSTFTGNSCASNETVGGGAIAILGTTTRIEGCTFTNNWARMGGALSIGMLLTGYKASAVQLIDSTLTGNEIRVTATYFGQGGGAIRMGPDDTLAISGSTSITGNQSRNEDDTADTAQGSAIVPTVGTVATSVRITGITSGNVANNTPTPQCGTMNGSNQFTPVASCVTWT